MGNTFKKVASLILVAVMIISGIPTMSFAETSTTFQYKGNGETGTTLYYNNSSVTPELFQIKGTPGNNYFNAYCVDFTTTIKNNAFYQPKFLEELTYINGNATNIRSVVTFGYPNVNTDTLETRVNAFLGYNHFKEGGFLGIGRNKLSTDDAIAATQAAAWFYSNGKNLNLDDSSDIKVVYNYLKSLQGTPKPVAAEIETTPAVTKIENGNVVISFTYKNAGTNPSVVFSLTGFTKSENTAAGVTTVTYTRPLSNMTFADFQAFNITVKGTKPVADVFAFHPVNGTSSSQTLVSIGYTFNTDVEKSLSGTIVGLAGKLTVNFDAKGGIAVAPKSVDFGSVVNPLPTTSLTGHAFAGWFLNDTTPFTNSTVIRNNTNVFAKWTPNKYTVTYNPDGGSLNGAPSTVEVLYNQSVASTPVPTKTGYEFKGWLTADNTAFTKDTKVVDNMTVKANWKINQFTVNFDENGGTFADGASPSVVVNYNTTVSQQTVSRVGYTFDGWYLGDSLYNFNTPVTGNINLVAHWSPVPVTVTFDSDGGSAVAPLDSTYGSQIGTLTIPTKVGHTFEGWYLPDATSPIQSNYVLTEDITLTAKWNIITYTVTFDAKGGSAVASIDVDHGNSIATAPSTSKVGHTFDGWFLAESLYSFGSPVTSNLNLVAKWTPIPVTVTFNSDGGSSVDPFVTFYGDELGILSTPTKTGFTFAGWYLPQATAPITGDYILTEDITLTAHWTQITYNVSFDAAGGSSVAPMEVAHGNVIDPVPTSTKAHYTFNGWVSAAEVALTSSLQITQDYTFVAQWVPEEYTVTFFTNGSTTVVPSEKVEFGNTAHDPNITPIKDGYTFKHWSLQGSTEPYDFMTPITEDITLIAQYTKDTVYYTVTFDTNGGEPSVAPATVVEGNAVAEPEVDPTKAGFTFSHWALQGETNAYDFATPVNASITLVAQYTLIPPTVHLVSFDTNGGTPSIDPASVIEGNTVAEPNVVPSKDGFTFSHWALQGSTDAYNFETPVTAPITLVAQYTENEVPPVTHVVTFDTNGGTPAIDPVTVNDGSAVSAPSVTPVKEGNSFSHWALQESTVAYNFSTPVTASITLVAQYTEITSEEPTQPPTTQPPSTQPPSTTQPTTVPVLPVDPEVELGIVRVEYVDAQGNTIADSFQFSGGVGTSYSTSPKTVEGYELSETPANATGVFTEATIVVTYVYTEATEVIDEEEVAQGEATTEVATEQETTEAVEIELEETPLADALPQTGQLPAELFYGAGSLITAIGVYLKKRK